MISLKQIHYALAVERTLHFKKAAEECHISQSALSTALAELEKQLGFQIFERDNRKVLVTPLGREVLSRARDIALQVEDLQKLAEAQREPLSTPLAMGVIPTIGPYLLPRVLPALQSSYPKLQLDFTEDESAQLLDMLRRGALDTAILALPYDCEGLLSFSFWAEDLYWVTHAEDPLAKSRKITTRQMSDAHLMLLKDGHCLKEHALAACHLEDLSSHRLSATSLATLIQLVAAGMGSTLVPEIALHALIEDNPKLVAIPLAEPGPHRELAFVVRPNYPGVANIEVLMQLFRAELQPLHK
ncbi:hydrogen peroxide-inducible genes activator [Mangrovimicrobium sediminis]|uniref:Hydrogen peroxide-inducible genes activator n=1 Tax=Mangrovimicrobium sediminis TaxID=2562682 RepID=A0A4Z0LXB1_9GAMM|nr:hydrogen peroxide-inducible genes activator [Haliea sp. SAOS-164]TGD71788.1 hydrogen peroxide-inducible genes activator [Haliea sp. SAOS-164]